MENKYEGSPKAQDTPHPCWHDACGSRPWLERAHAIKGGYRGGLGFRV